MLKKKLGGILLAAFAVVAAPAAAQETAAPQTTINAPLSSAADQQALQYSTGTYLGYVTGPSSAVNEEARQGMNVLAGFLAERTAVRPSGVVGLDLENDDISLIPFIYFPIDFSTPALSADAQRKVQRYLDNGGFLMIDTRDYGASVNQPRDLARVLGSVNIRPLVPMPQDHVLTQSFYLVGTLTGTVPDGTVWVEEAGTPNAENVTGVLIGGRNWAGAWAATTLPPGAQRNKALQAGANIVIHALTGNYKLDQSHLREVLDRMRPR